MNHPPNRALRIVSMALLGLCLLRIAAWMPEYLGRPWFADHDVFATMARGWDAGMLPYRDLVSNNFPGTIYFFWGLGKTFGWGCAPALYAADAALLLALVAMTLAWSRARFGQALPGVVGLVAMTSYYLDLDFSQAAQRDWHASALVVLGLLAAQAWPTRGGRWLAVAGFSAAMVTRPQVILLLPALLLSLTERLRLAGASTSSTIKAVSAWLAVVGLAVFAGFLPLLLEGVLGDFLEGLRVLAYGGSYNKKNIFAVALILLIELIDYRACAVLVSLAVLARRAGGSPGRALATAWLAALAGVLLYMPLSPGSQPYLLHPLWLVWSIGLAVVVGEILGSVAPPSGLLCVLLALQMAGMAWPRFSHPGPVGATFAALRKGREVRQAPLAYRHPYGNMLHLPDWEDYRDVMDYLRTTTAPGTRVANLLNGVAITGPTGLLSALPAESVTWLFGVKPGDEAKFARALEECPDSIAVTWASGEIGKFDHPLPEVEKVFRRFYVPEARFGSLEVWRRRPKE